MASNPNFFNAFFEYGSFIYSSMKSCLTMQIVLFWTAFIWTWYHLRILWNLPNFCFLYEKMYCCTSDSGMSVGSFECNYGPWQNLLLQSIWRIGSSLWRYIASIIRPNEKFMTNCNPETKKAGNGVLHSSRTTSVWSSFNFFYVKIITFIVKISLTGIFISTFWVVVVFSLIVGFFFHEGFV